MIILSPHLDDAVFSCGAAIALLSDVLVITVCAAVPDGVGPGPLDVRSGFRSGAEAVSARREEDERALAHLGARALHLDVLDGAYGGGDVSGAIEDVLPSDGEVVVCPLGLHHPDHIAVANAFAPHAKRFRSWFYAELPYAERFLYDFRQRLRHQEVTVKPVTVPWSEAKAEAMALYPSQLVDTDLAPYHAPERYFPC